MLVLSFPLTRPAAAFFPEYTEVVQEVENNLGELSSLQLEIAFPHEPRLKCNLWIKHDRWRQEWVFEDDGRLGVVAAAIGNGSGVQASYCQRAKFPLPITTFWYQPDVSRLWSAQGIDPRYRAYRFFADTPCVVFGAKRRLFSLPQVWIHAEQDVPVRLKMNSGLVWSWSGYRNIGNFYIPHRVSLDFVSGDSLEISLSWRGINREIPDSLFDLSRFRQKFSNAPEPGCELELFDLLFSKLPAVR